MSAAASPKSTLLFDTNVLLDVILRRVPHAVAAARLLDAASKDTVRGFVAGHAITTVHYIVERETRDRARAVTAVSDLLSILTVVELGQAEFQRALSLGLRDFEDAVQAAACLKVGAEFLVTRNAADFRGAPVVPIAAGEVLAILATR